MEKEIIQVNQLPSAKIEIAEFAKKIENYLDSGECKASDILAKFKGIEKVAEYIKPKLTKLVVDEISKYGKEAELNGITFKIQEFGTKYFFDETGDTVWKKLKEEVDKANKALKAREDFLKTIKNSETLVDQNSAEIITVYAPIKISTTGIAVTIK